MNFSQEDLDDLAKAKKILENPGIAAKITHLIGQPIEKSFNLLPASWKEKVGELTRSALMKAMDAAAFTMKDSPGKAVSNKWHAFAVALTGGAGGLFGLPALAVELPVSTTIMLRSIADIARSEGESIRDAGFKIACIEVFALGGPSPHDNATESGYFAIRAGLAQSVTDAVQHVTRKGMTSQGAPALVRFITLISERFSIQVSEKAAVQAIPAIGAAGGAAINALFIDHFQDMARGHFTVRRLEKKHGKQIVAETYKKL